LSGLNKTQAVEKIETEIDMSELLDEILGVLDTNARGLA
jgi:hypothetical protein